MPSNLTEKEILLKINEKVDKLQDKLHKMEVGNLKANNDIHAVLSKQEDNLSRHMRRTEIAEENIDILKNEIKPVLQGLGFLKSLAKFASFVGTLLYAWAKFKR